jgi:ABC-type branched-subunit amino acid transport system substrate-binding protein/predicted negative regulator of RcsB-dependent stress response
MKLDNIIFFLVTVTFIWACAPKIVYEKPDIGEHLFSRGERMIQTKSYEKALATFNEYISRFPDSPLADSALMKIGAIYTELGESTEALNVYKRLATEYPDSHFVSDARIQILLILYNQGEYIKVINQAAEFLIDTDSNVHIQKTYGLLGDTYMALGFPIDAVNYYTRAFNTIKDPENEIIIAKLKEAIRQLDSTDIEFLLSRMEDNLTTGYLMYQMGLNSAEKEKYDKAIKVLSVFIEKFPEHENVEQAKNIIAEINKKSLYSRYTIGCLLPLSGPYKMYGNRALKGVELALNRFSSQDTHPSIKIVIKDTGSDPARAVLSVIELFNENVAAIIGPIITAEPAALEAQKRGIPVITLTQKDNIAKIGDYVFRNFFTPAMQVKSLVSYAAEDLGLRSFAILYPEENYGETFMNLFWDEVITNGGKVVGVESYNSDDTDFADPIKKLVGLYYDVPEDLVPQDPVPEYPMFEDPVVENPVPEDPEDKTTPIIDFDAIFIPDAPKKAGLIIPQLAFYDVKDTYLLGTNLWHSDSLIKMTRRYVQGAILTDGFFAESTSKHIGEFVSDFQEIFGQKPEFIEAVAYDSTMILLQTVSRPDIRFRSTLKNELKKLTGFQGITDHTSFDDDGNVRKKLYLLQVKGKKFVEVERMRGTHQSFLNEP